MGKISEKIDEIIAERQKQLPLIQAAREKAMSAEDKMRAFRMFQKGMPTQGTEFEENIASIKTDDFEKSLKEYLDSLDIMEQRLSRRSLNISFIGRAGQGKSVVMQSISGLGRSVIPSSNREDCTGAKSVITNTESDKVEAEITFFDEIELVDIVNKYLEVLFQHKISNVRDIPSINISKIINFLDETGKKDPDQEHWIEHLEKYVKHYNDYAGDLGKKITVPEEDIEKYVAQYSSKNAEEKYYKYLGVKLADIKTRFPHEDTGRIVLVDTIGIGATSLGTEEAMLKTAETDSDAILLMFLPASDRGRISNNEVYTVHKIEECVSKKYAREMLFWVVNRKDTHDSGSNVDQVRDVVKRLETKDYKNAGIFNVNCADSAEVERDLIVPLLERMSSRIQNADSILIERLNEKGKKAFEEYDKICQQLDIVFRIAPSEDIMRKLNVPMRAAYNKGIAGSLRWLYSNKNSEYRQKRNEPCEDLVNEAEIKLKKIFDAVPTTEFIMKIMEDGGLKQHDTYSKCSDKIRIEVINDFETLDKTLFKIVESMKQDLLEILTSEEKGRLGFVVPFKKGETSSDEWIAKFLAKTECKAKYHLFANALEKLQVYSIKVNGFLIHEVREALEELDVALSGDPHIAADLSDLEVLAEEIHEILEDKAEKIYNDLQNRLKPIYSFPHRSIYAAITDFYDRMTFSYIDDAEPIQKQMEFFYKDWCGIIWQEICQQDEQLRNISAKWNEIKKTLTSMDNAEYFKVSA